MDNLKSHNQDVADSFDSPAFVPGFEDWTEWPPNELKVQRLTATAVLPTRSHETDAGLDLYADEDITLHFGQVVKIKTGCAFEVPVGFYGDVRSRSSYWSRGLHVEGTLDSDYRGELLVVMGWLARNGKEEKEILPYQSWNGQRYISINVTLGDKPVSIKRGDKIAQLVLTHIITPKIVEVNELSDTGRGSDGFGSTGE